MGDDLLEDRSSRPVRRPENKTGRRSTDYGIDQLATRKVVVVSNATLAVLIAISESTIRFGFFGLFG